MKKILPAFFALLILGSCKTSKDYLLRADEDRTFFDIVKKLNKRNNDEDATKAIAEVYSKVQERHLKKIAGYSSDKEISRWDKIAVEYNALQKMYDAIESSPAAGNLVKSKNYRPDFDVVKRSAAEDYYQQGLVYLFADSREAAKRAYNSFKKATTWVNNFKDSKARMDEAFNNAVVIVMINPIQDNSFFFNTGWGNSGYNYSNEYFQQNLVRDLGGKYATRYPAKFYTEWEARRDDVQPDWVIDLVLRDMDIPRPYISNYNRNVSQRIETGKDTSGKATYETVYATVNIQKQSFNARGRMDIRIIDVNNRNTIASSSYSDTYNWQEESATYSGDRRALSSNDWALINNNNFNVPQKEDILNELYRNIYPQIKNRISNEVDW